MQRITYSCCKGNEAFILNDSVKSFLCLNNKLPQENKGLFDIKLLEEFADAIIKLYGIKGLKR